MSCLRDRQSEGRYWFLGKSEGLFCNQTESCLITEDPGDEYHQDEIHRAFGYKITGAGDRESDIPKPSFGKECYRVMTVVIVRDGGDTRKESQVDCLGNIARNIRGLSAGL
jgi:hypothetical protein